MGSITEIEIIVKNYGLISYNDTWNIQKELFTELINNKQNGKKNRKNYIIYCSHNHVITIGKSGDESNLINPFFKVVEFVKTDRGGDITYHGPGQLVVYPIIDLEEFRLSLREYIFLLEQTVIETLKYYGIESGRIKEYTGVWIDYTNIKARKIAAIGVKASKYITMHGLAFNINTDLKYFDLIIPCGIIGKSVTSIEKELGVSINFEEIANKFKFIFENKLKYLIDNV